ncbi:DUF3492 domain-containing protein [Streptomyces sp. WMMC897]|uniref:DUF3492 domain-containing protein n=1 Tax=Streptomyces sp. WMMC897 TaxID=3014782 RepID=UPI0022B722E2|nr:DUF3492 domain-containing protein [Streptomyces sp. WMMC897]MCZ7416676.1 DUF3492 domain-containing protein [Streptomyces sp. WMMC897]
MRIALLTEGGFPYVRGESVHWCEQLVHGLAGHEFTVYALSRSRRQAEGERLALPPQVRGVRTARLWGPPDGGGPGERRGYGRRVRAQFEEHLAELTGAVCAEAPQADRFANGLHGLADLAGTEPGRLSAALCSERALRVLEAACRAPEALRAVRSATVADLLAVMERLERALRPLSLDWYAAPADADESDPGLSTADLCHAVGGGPGVLPGLLARRRFGVPLLLTEYGVRVREQYLGGAARAVAPAAAAAPVRALLASFQTRLAGEAYRCAEIITPGNAHARRWQERCGADRDRQRTVYPGMDAHPFAAVDEDDGAPDPDPTLVWTGPLAPAKDLVALLHAFAEVRRAEPRARLLLVETGGRADEGYAAHCRALAAQLFPDEAADPRSVGTNPVTFTEVGSPAVPWPADAYAGATVVVLSSVVEGFPVSLVEAMFSGRATVSTDAGAVCEVIGGTGLVVPPRNPRALAEACLQLLRDPARRARLGAAARARALELFTVEQNLQAFHGMYLELIAGRRAGEPLAAPSAHPFGRTAEGQVPGRWAAARRAPVRPAPTASPTSPAHAPAHAQAQPQGQAQVPSWARAAGEPVPGREPVPEREPVPACAPVPAVAGAAEPENRG